MFEPPAWPLHGNFVLKQANGPLFLPSGRWRSSSRVKEPWTVSWDCICQTPSKSGSARGGRFHPTVALPWKDTSSCPTWLGTRGWNGNVFLPIPRESGPIPSHRSPGRSRGMGYARLSSPTILCMQRTLFSSDRKLVLFHPSSCPFRSVFACCVPTNTSPYTVIRGGTCPLDSHNPPQTRGPIELPVGYTCEFMGRSKRPVVSVRPTHQSMVAQSIRSTCAVHQLDEMRT